MLSSIGGLYAWSPSTLGVEGFFSVCSVGTIILICSRKHVVSNGMQARFPRVSVANANTRAGRPSAGAYSPMRTRETIPTRFSGAARGERKEPGKVTSGTSSYRVVGLACLKNRTSKLVNGEKAPTAWFEGSEVARPPRRCENRYCLGSSLRLLQPILSNGLLSFDRWTVEARHRCLLPLNLSTRYRNR